MAATYMCELNHSFFSGRYEFFVQYLFSLLAYDMTINDNTLCCFSVFYYIFKNEDVTLTKHILFDRLFL